MISNPRRILCAVAVAALLSACAAQAPKDTSLYGRLGGQKAIEAVVDDFLANVVSNPQINYRFANTDAGKLRRLLVEQVCAGTGGPCKYTGRDMVTAHRGMGVTQVEFNAMGADMQKTLDKFNVPKKEQQELMTLLGSMQNQIVGQ